MLELVQAKKSNVITYNLFDWTTFHRKKYVHEIEFCINVLIEAADRRLI